MKNKLYEMYLNLRINRTEKAIKKFEKLILEWYFECKISKIYEGNIQRAYIRALFGRGRKIDFFDLRR